MLSAAATQSVRSVPRALPALLATVLLAPLAGAPGIAYAGLLETLASRALYRVAERVVVRQPEHRLTSPGRGFSGCGDVFANGRPPVVSAASPSRPRELCFDNFAVLHSGQSKTAIYAAERLNRATLEQARGEPRTDRFYAEARLPHADRAQLADYRTTENTPQGPQHYDRGHLAPAADRESTNAMAQSFSLSNMVPQIPEHNRGAWAKSVEKATRSYVMRAAGDVYVITGPVFTAGHRTLGAGRVWVPDYLYKLVYDATTNRAWAYWLANTKEARVTGVISYTELVRRTGIEFLPGTQPRD